MGKHDYPIGVIPSGMMLAIQEHYFTSVGGLSFEGPFLREPKPEAHGVPGALGLLMQFDKLRADLEHAPSYQQIIPYIVVRREGSVFIYRRGDPDGDERLTGKYSIGVGGHLEDKDQCGPDTVGEGMRREFHEELKVTDYPHASPPWEWKHVGLIWGHETEVSRVHTGLVFILDLPAGTKVETKKETADGWFAPVEEIKKLRSQIPYDRMEGWSHIILEYLL